jgi:hypothetical protein
MSAAILNRLLRAPGEIAEDCREDRDLRAIAVTSLIAVALGAAAFGGVIGSFRGGIQILYAGVKLPAALLLTLAICAPAFHALAATLGRAFPMRSIIALALASAGRAALVLLALSPLVWIVLDRGLGYHEAALVCAAAYAVAGAAALGVILRGLGEGSGRLLTALAFAGVFFAVTGQTGWIFRPYLVRPRTWTASGGHMRSVPFLRAYEGSFADSLYLSSRSARGIYDEAPAPAPAPASEGESR